jgi:hypothetical protein
MQIIARHETASLDILFICNGENLQLLFNVDRNVVLGLKKRSYQRFHLQIFHPERLFNFSKNQKKIAVPYCVQRGNT